MTDPNGVVRWCCTENIVNLAPCDRQRYGQLILEKGRDGKFSGNHTQIAVPAVGEMNEHNLKDALFLHLVPGAYVTLLANCNEHGRTVKVSGRIAYLPSADMPPTRSPATPAPTPQLPISSSGSLDRIHIFVLVLLIVLLTGGVIVVARRKLQARRARQRNPYQHISRHELELT